MLRLFGWMVAGGVLLGSASIATAQDPQAVGTGGVPAVPGAGYGYSGINAYNNLLAPGMDYGPGCADASGGCCSDPCFTLYPLTTTYPYSYVGPGTGFGSYSYVPYPYVPVGYGWYGQYWRGW